MWRVAGVFAMLVSVALMPVQTISGQRTVQLPETISGILFNAETGDVLPYVTVVVKGRGTGVISDREGRFELGSKNISETDVLVFSHVGFDTHSCTVGGLSAGNYEIALRPGVYAIDPVVVTNRRSRLVKLGHSSAGTGFIQAGWFDRRGDAQVSQASYDDVNREGGVAIKIRNDSQILAFGMAIHQNGYESALMRLSFYELENNVPGKLIVNQDIKFELTDRTTGRFETDLSQYDIWFAAGREVLVTLTLLEDEMGAGTKNAFMLNASLGGNGVYTRKAGAETWNRSKGLTITMYLKAKIYYK